MGTLLKTSDQSRRIISISEPRSSTSRFSGRMTVPAIMGPYLLVARRRNRGWRRSESISPQYKRVAAPRHVRIPGDRRSPERVGLGRPAGACWVEPRVHLWARCHEKEKYSGSDTGTGREVMGATFGPSRAIAVLLAAAMALVGLSFVGTPASSEDAISFQFSVAGDFGSWSGFRESLDQLNASGSDFALALGDLSYGGNTGYANTTEEAWCSKFHKFFPKIEIIAGNHDTGDTIAGEGDINQFIAYCPFNIKTSVDGVYGKQYAFDFPRNNPLARFILISPDLVFRVDDGEHYSYDVGTPRYDWTKGQIEDAKAKGIPWVIVGFHKNCIGAGEHHCETGTDILNLLIQEKVDLVLNAHEHNYERSHQLAYTDSCPQGVQEHVFVPRCIVHDGTDGNYQRGDGSVVG